jgi:hypothetical protein
MASARTVIVILVLLLIGCASEVDPEIVQKAKAITPECDNLEEWVEISKSERMQILEKEKWEESHKMINECHEAWGRNVRKVDKH